MDKLKVSLEFPGCGVSGISAASIQDQGAREYQEDCCGFSVSPGAPGEPARSFCAVVADGMGGLSAGAFVSDYTVKRLLGSNIGDSAESGSVPEQLLSAVRRISGEIAAGGSRGGSTLAAVVCVPEGVYFCSVGDSRIYLLRRGLLTQLTEDGDYFNILLEKVISGQITYEQAENDLDKDALSQFIGIGFSVVPDRNLIPLSPEPGDRLLICSDGVYNALSHEEIMQSMTLSAPAAAEDLTGRILVKGYTNQDNFTAAALEFLPGEQSEAPMEKR